MSANVNSQRSKGNEVGLSDRLMIDFQPFRHSANWLSSNDQPLAAIGNYVIIRVHS